MNPSVKVYARIECDCHEIIYLVTRHIRILLLKGVKLSDPLSALIACTDTLSIKLPQPLLVPILTGAPPGAAYGAQISLLVLDLYSFMSEPPYVRQGMPQVQTETGGIVLADICGFVSVQGRCYPTGRCTYRLSVTGWLSINSSLSLSVAGCASSRLRCRKLPLRSPPVALPITSALPTMHPAETRPTGMWSALSGHVTIAFASFTLCKVKDALASPALASDASGNSAVQQSAARAA